jgi:hypothetical protein
MSKEYYSDDDDFHPIECSYNKCGHADCQIKNKSNRRPIIKAQQQKDLAGSPKHTVKLNFSEYEDNFFDRPELKDSHEGKKSDVIDMVYGKAKKPKPSDEGHQPLDAAEGEVQKPKITSTIINNASFEEAVKKARERSANKARKSRAK